LINDHLAVAYSTDEWRTALEAIAALKSIGGDLGLSSHQLHQFMWAPVRTCWFSAGLKLQGRDVKVAPLSPSHGRGKASRAINRPLNRWNRAEQHEEDRFMTMQSKNTDEEALHDQTG
jgi:hypothetical protein